MRALIALIIFTCISCANRFEIPSDINVSAAPVTGTVTVRHEIVVSVEMSELFANECTAEADRQGLIEPVRSEYITLCVNKKTTDFINSILAIINSQQQQGAK